MGGSYAGILGPIAFLLALARGWLNAAPVEATLLVAWLSLLVFAAVGYVIGRIAGWIVDDSARAQITAELATQEAQPTAKQPVVAVTLKSQ